MATKSSVEKGNVVETSVEYNRAKYYIVEAKLRFDKDGKIN